MSVFDGIQYQQMAKSIMPHTDIESKGYRWERTEILHTL